MLYFAVTAILFKCAFGITDEQRIRIRNEFIETGTRCILKYPITIEDVKSFRNKEFPSSEHAGCFVACIFHNTGIFDDEGTLSQKTAVEKAKKHLDNETDLNNLQQFIAVCDKVNEENVTDGQKGCERGKLAFECLIENSEQFGFNYEF